MPHIIDSNGARVVDSFDNSVILGTTIISPSLIAVTGDCEIGNVQAWPIYEVVFSITGGADQALFEIDSATGALAFLTPPNAHSPADADLDNVYEVEVTASQGGSSDAVTIEVTVIGTRGVPTGELLQVAVDTQRATGRNVVMAAGQLLIPETISTPFVAGGRVQGKGEGEPIDTYAHPLQGIGTQLIWEGPREVADEDPMIGLYGAYWELDGFSMYGAQRYRMDLQTEPEPDLQPLPKAPVGILVNRPGDRQGLGVGKHHLSNMFLSYFRTAIQHATDNIHELNCEQCLHTNLSIDRCDVGVLVRNDQSLGHTFVDLDVYGTPVIFKYQAGGDLTVFRMFTPSECTILQFDPVQSGVGFGHNNAVYSFDSVELDYAAGNTMLVDMPPGYYDADIFFNNVRFQYIGYTSPAAVVSGNTRLTIRDARKLQAGMFAWNNPFETTLPSIIIDNSRAWKYPGLSTPQDVNSVLDLFDVTNSIGQCHVRVTNLRHHGTGENLPDFEDVLGTPV
ncbi:cadherin repeat domain-containing protein [Lacipirellula sp.]|uniref:cadherin repeat domain-containing protein n=1 Tax=Lacipirellula sp. TaxID=2691419 RepID=UPI003D14E3AA